MINRSAVRTGIFIVFLALILAGSFWRENVSGSDSPGKENAGVEGQYSFGGGYAASSQIPGVNWLPVLYDASNGLPTSEANCILAASDGYIWIGGYSGVTKYDGVNFEKLPVTDGLTSARYFFEDSTGRIWVATNDNGVVVINGQGKCLYRFSKKDGLSSNSIRSFAEDPQGNVFIGSTAGVAYVGTDMNLRIIDDERINNERVLRLVTDTEGTVYGQTSSGRIFIVTPDGIPDGCFYKSSELGIKKITTILADPEEPGILYFGTSGKFIYHGRFGDSTGKMEKIDTGSAKNIHWLDHACGRLWVSTTETVGYIDENNTFIPFNSLPIKDSFEMMTSDYQGNMWFASSRYGVMKFVADHFLDITSAAGLEPEVVNAVCKRDNRLLIGTDSGLRIIEIDNDSSTGEYYKVINNTIPSYFQGFRIRCIMNDSLGNTWFSVFSGNRGLVCLRNDGRIMNYTVNNGLPTNEIRCTYEMKDGTLIVGTNAGIALMKDGEVTEVYGASNPEMKNTVILTVCEGDNGEIYAGTDGGGIYAIKNGEITHLGTEDGLGSDVIMRIKRDEKRDLIWIITSNDVEYMQKGKITTVTSFPYNNNFDVIPVGDDDLWFISSKGIYIVDARAVVNDSISESDYRLYDSANGLTSMPISHCYSSADDTGNIFIAGQTGVSMVNSGKLDSLAQSILSGIGSVYFDGTPIYPDKDGKYVLPAGSGRLQINPSVLDYTISNPTVRLKLQGMDDDWSETDRSGIKPLEYTGLKAYDYTLHVQVLDSITRKLISEGEFRFIKQPGFFERTPVRIMILALAVAIIGFLIWRIRTGAGVIRRQYAQIQEARDEAERANEAKSRFLANMSHEIRTPINMIMGMDEMILREDTKDVKREYSTAVTGYARDIKYASESLLNLVNDLLDISKIESGKAHLVEQEYDTVELLRGIASMIRGRAEDKKLYFDLDIDETLPKRLYGDGGKIKQIILNMLTNAVKYTDEGGFKLTVKVTERTEAGVGLRISVKDTGIGIKQEEIDKLFTAYERLDEVRNSNIQGTGLGLDISKQFVEMMGGRLWCESIYGEGSEFLFTLKQKIADNNSIGVFLEKTGESAVGAYKPQFVAPDADILVVDDNPMNLNVIKGLLKPTKVFVTTAASGEECLKKIAVNIFNVVLLDHMMPGMDGIETLAKIREEYPDLPVYALTANSTAGGEEFYVSKGFNGYLTKPVDIIAVEHAIMRHLPENIMSKPSDQDIVTEETTLGEDMLWLENAEGISVPDGIKNSGGVSQFIFSLNMFYDSIDENSSVIEKAYDSEDFKLATVKVHALKSSARIIGALKLSEDCQALEDAGNRKDMDYICSHKDKLLADYRAFKAILKKLKGDEDSGSDKPEIPESELKDAYSALKDCIGQMDYDAVEMILTQLKEYRLSGKDDETVKALEKSLKQVNWDEMEEVIKNV